MKGVRIRPARLADVDRLWELERRLFSDPWTRGMIEEEVGREPARVLVAELSPAEPADGGGNADSRNRVAGRNHGVSSPVERRIIGYVFTMELADELHVANIAVVPEHRRRGWGRRLLEAALRAGRARGARTAWLEVRASNEEAQRLYTAAGFRPVGRRRAYYLPAEPGAPREDALLYRLDLERSPFLEGKLDR